MIFEFLGFEACWIQALVMTLLHSIWQGLMVLCVWKLVKQNKSILKRISSNALLYLLPFVFLILVLHTFLQLGFHPQSSVLADMGTSVIANASLDLHFIWPTLATCWLVGAMIHSYGVFRAYINLKGIVHSSTMIEDHPIIKTFDAFKSEMKHAHSAQLRFSPNIDGPMVIGFFKPVILFPICLANQLSLKEAEAILAHEMSHIAKNDYAFNFMLSIIQSLFFFNPFVLQLVKEIKAERELRCDRMAIELTGDPFHLAQALINLKERKFKLSPEVRFNGEGELITRIRQIMDIPSQKSTSFVRTPWLIMTMVGVLPFFSFNDRTETMVTDIDRAIQVDTINLPGFSHPIKSLEYMVLDGKIDQVSVNNEEIANPSKEQKIELQSKKSIHTTKTNRVKEYESYIEEELPKVKSEMKMIRHQKASKEHSGLHAQIEEETEMFISFHRGLDKGIGFGKSFDTLQCFVGNERLWSESLKEKMQPGPEKAKDDW